MMQIEFLMPLYWKRVRFPHHLLLGETLDPKAGAEGWLEVRVKKSFQAVLTTAWSDPLSFPLRVGLQGGFGNRSEYALFILGIFKKLKW